MRMRKEKKYIFIYIYIYILSEHALLQPITKDESYNITKDFHSWKRKHRPYVRSAAKTWGARILQITLTSWTWLRWGYILVTLTSMVSDAWYVARAASCAFISPRSARIVRSKSLYDITLETIYGMKKMSRVAELFKANAERSVYVFGNYFTVLLAVYSGLYHPNLQELMYIMNFYRTSLQNILETWWRLLILKMILVLAEHPWNALQNTASWTLHKDLIGLRDWSVGLDSIWSLDSSVLSKRKCWCYTWMTCLPTPHGDRYQHPPEKLIENNACWLFLHAVQLWNALQHSAHWTVHKDLYALCDQRIGADVTHIYSDLLDY